MQLFEKSVDVQIKSSNIEEKKEITINISQSVNESKKGLHIQLTDELDPFFLYQIEINEVDFCELKTQQTLLVDFIQFPFKFIELLDLCIKSSNEEHPKFICKLTKEASQDFGLFSIVETNSFKHINHLSLKFIPGNDASTKIYLAQVVNELKKEISSTEQSNVKCSKALSEAEQQISKLTVEFEHFKSSAKEEQNMLKLKHAQDLAIQKEKYLGDKDSFRNTNECQLREFQAKHESEVFFA